MMRARSRIPASDSIGRGTGSTPGAESYSREPSPRSTEAAGVSPFLAGTAIIGLAATGSKLLLILALFCVGLEINRQTLRQLRGAAVLQGLLLWLVVAPLSLLLVLKFS